MPSAVPLYAIARPAPTTRHIGRLASCVQQENFRMLWANHRVIGASWGPIRVLLVGQSAYCVHRAQSPRPTAEPAPCAPVVSTAISTAILCASTAQPAPFRTLLARRNAWRALRDHTHCQKARVSASSVNLVRIRRGQTFHVRSVRLASFKMPQVRWNACRALKSSLKI